ncbi:hypothetical protein QQ045_010739 [Rhodiola kirilowii]
MARVRDTQSEDDPYFIRNTEITGSSIVSKVCVGRQNFVSWAKSMEIALPVRSKLDFVLVTIPEVDHDEPEGIEHTAPIPEVGHDEPDDIPAPQPAQNIVEPVRRSTRQHQAPHWQDVYVCNNIKIRKSPHNINKFLSNSHCSARHAAFSVVVANLKEPKTDAQASKDPQWYDVLLTGTSLVLIDNIKAFIHDKFKIKDLDTLKYFLGLEVARNSTDCKPAKTTLPIKHQLSLSTAAAIEDHMVYRKLIGKFIYLTITRPDLTHSVHILSQFMSVPNSDHLKAANRLLRYIKGASAQGLFFSASSALVMTAFCDADWAAYHKTRRSTSGYCIRIGDSLVSWRTKKQAIASRSSAESEYRAMVATCSEILWLTCLFSDMKASVPVPISLHCDSQAAIHIAKNPVFYERTKHIFFF